MHNGLLNTESENAVLPLRIHLLPSTAFIANCDYSVATNLKSYIHFEIRKHLKKNLLICHEVFASGVFLQELLEKSAEPSAL